MTVSCEHFEDCDDAGFYCDTCKNNLAEIKTWYEPMTAKEMLSRTTSEIPCHVVIYLS